MDDECDLSPTAVVVEASAAHQTVSLTFGPPAEVQPRVKGLLEIARLGSIFGIVASEADALK